MCIRGLGTGRGAEERMNRILGYSLFDRGWWSESYATVPVCQAPEEKAEQYHVSVDWVLDGAQYRWWSESYATVPLCQAPEEKAEQYHVSVDWVLDGAQYNEWMNEEDYELEENGKVKVSCEHFFKEMDGE